MQLRLQLWKDWENQETLLEQKALINFHLKLEIFRWSSTRLSPTEIRQFQITVLSEEDIKSVLALLNPPNLAKVLLNISQEDLAEIQNMLSPSTFNQTLNRLSDANRTQVQDRLSEISSSLAILQ